MVSTFIQFANQLYINWVITIWYNQSTIPKFTRHDKNPPPTVGYYESQTTL